MAAAPQREYPSYWAIVWEQFRKQRTSMIALYTVVLLFVIAIYAPVLSSSVPFIWRDESGLSFPWFRSLLFNRNLFDGSIDIFFNMLLVLSPFFLVSRLVLGRRIRDLETRKASKVENQHLAVWAMILIGLFLIMNSIEPRVAVPEYRELAAAGADTFSLFPPLRIQCSDTLHGATGPGLSHLLGIDDAGRDIFVRMVYGTRVSLSVGVIAVSIYITIGTTVGAVAGYFGGTTDMVAQRFIEIFLCFPSFFLILTFTGFLRQPSIIWIMVFIGIVRWTGPARLVRGEFLRLKNIDFVTAARASGLTNTRVIFRHVLPNAMGPLLVNATFGVAAAILVESTLSFLGLGDPTLPSWGRILSYGRATGDTRMMLIAGFAIFVTVSAFNLSGEGFRDALDPKLRR